MRTLSSALIGALNREDLTLCRLFELNTKSGINYYFTDLSSDITYAGIRYRSDAGITVSSIRNSIDNKQSNASVDVGLLDDYLNEEQVRYGDIDTANFKLSVIDYNNKDAGIMELFTGVVSEVSAANRYQVTLEISGFTTNTLNVGEVYSQRCRNIFGDKRCKVNPDANAVEFAVMSVEVGGAQFRITAETETGIVKPAESETNSITYGPGLHEFTVPIADLLTVELNSASGAGGESAWFLMNGDSGRFEVGRNGGDGQSSAFGNYATVEGGKGGIGGGNSITEIPYADGSKPVGGGPIGGLGSANPLISYYLFPGSTVGNQGAPGNKKILSFILNTTGSPQVGDTIEVAVGYGGNPDGHLGGVSFQGLKGNDGYAVLTWSRNQAIVSNEYNLGTIVWISGKNKGQISTIALNDSGLISLANPTSFAIQVGDRGRFRPGCSNYADMCEVRYNNLHNMQAEPVVPIGTVNGLSSPALNKVADKDKPFNSSDTTFTGSLFPQGA